MWSLVPRSVQIMIVVALGVIATTIAAAMSAWFTGEARPQLWFVSLAATIITIIIIPLAQVLWRPVWRLVPILNRWLFPDLNGTWDGEAVPVDDGAPRRPVTVWIRQGLFDVTVTLQSDQLESHSTRAVVEIDRRAHKVRIWYGYEGRPPPELAKENPRHDGAACLEMDPERDRDALTGRYFTDRGTAGSIALTRRTHHIVGAR
ncbi:MAG: hypothetical protein KF779_00045 [Hyphomonadaceae bacterium]|nr:hypothetical protein [Hyphomonadaceae bacterium]